MSLRKRVIPIVGIGFAIAVVAAYYLFKKKPSSGQPQRRNPVDRQSTSSRSSSSNFDNHSTTNHPSNTRESRGNLNTNTNTINPAIIGKRRRIKVTVTADSFMVNVSGEYQYVDEAVKHKIGEIKEQFDLYLVVKATSDKEEALLKRWLGKEEFDLIKTVFHEVDEGRIHIVRQIDPTIHVETSEKNGEILKTHIPSVIVIGNKEKKEKNVEYSRSLSTVTAFDLIAL